jgi:hypothetical protein
MTTRKFDWRSHHDSESKKYSIRATLRNQTIEKKKVMWAEGIVTDQGSEGACVGFAWMNEMLAKPVAPEKQPPVSLANSLAYSYYRDAQKIDEWPGEDYEGTSVLAGAKIMQRNGYIKEYRWCFGVSDVRDAVISQGPVVTGIPWYSGMYQTSDSGLVKVSGSKVGGHAIVITGYNPNMVINGRREEVFRWRNSWGINYGINGSGYIKYKDLEKLLKEQGEACVPMLRSEPVFKIEEKRIDNKIVDNTVINSKRNLFSILKGLFCK